MEEIKVVIDISKHEWEYLNRLVGNGDQLGHYERLIVNGTPLPKDYERLIDEKILLRKLRSRNFGFNLPTWVKVAIDDTPTIIEADKEESMTYLEGLDKIMEAMKKRELDQNAQRTVYLGLITTQLATIADELARMNGSVKSGVHCACTDEEISKSFMEDVSAVEEQLPKQSDDKIVHVGDEICSITGDKAVVQGIDTWHRYQCFTDNGDQLIIDTETFNDYWAKTGKNYPQIAEVLKQMKEA